MENTLASIAAWLSMSFALPSTDEHPRVHFVAPQEMQALWQRRATQEPGHSLTAGSRRAARGGPRIEAFYDDATRTIYLAEGWTGKSAAESSVLVHEMVHHLQNVSGLRYACRGEREEPAYAAQAQWLALFGRSLESEFKLDRVTLFVRTRCLG